ncbi:MAG: protein-export chaperone SecB [Gammaproteobacteria bacterium RIFCSPHIGHO2_12_FULL_38_11]|nr:MAG: protein-export chaperone SecB [Gammaproteobacteria bacterium RIFCSPHIGHO2_12_FULL_38_11]
MTEPTPIKPTEQQGPEFAIQRLYVKDLSLETPNSPKSFLEPWEPQLHMDLATDASLILEEGVREVVLTVTVTVKLKEKVAFLVEVKQAGIFAMKGFNDEQSRHMLGSYCPNILYPFAREVVSDAVMRAGFPQLYLAPVNFDALYEQSQKEAKH